MGQKRIFLSSIFFVLGFSVVFSLVGVLLQSVLAHSAPIVQKWLGRVGGVIIILFGLYIMHLIEIPWLGREHKIAVTKTKSGYITSFLFGAAFAVGWTPCVTAALGAILALAATAPNQAFFLLLAYTLGLGIPFLLVGLFADQAQRFIKKSMAWIKYVQYVFGVILIIMGVLVFTSQLSRIANLEFVVTLLTTLNITPTGGGTISMLNFFNLGIAFFAGLVSFLSPCILPLIPAFLSYLASMGVEK